MPSDYLTPEARRENAAALASALGFGLEEAANALDLDIAVTADPDDSTAQQIVREISDLLSRTVRHVYPPLRKSTAAAEIIIGSAAAKTAADKVYLAVFDDHAVINLSQPTRDPCAPVPGILLLLVACYASAAALQRALGGSLPFRIPEPLVVPFAELGIDLSALAKPVDIGRAYMAGAGAIGNGFLWAARHLDFRGQLDLVDDDRVSSGNLNRQIWFDSNDIGFPKVDRLYEKAKGFVANLQLVPRRCRLQDLPEKSASPWLRRLIVAVDSRRARRELQNEFPREVFDASTTDIREVVLHYNIQPTALACLSCIYEPDQEEISREQHIAEHLDVSVEDVRSQRIAAPVAELIAKKFSGLVAADIEGMAYDSLFKRLCAESQLRTPAGRTVIAPFAFVSVFAGTLLALEVVRRLGHGNSTQNFNYWRLSPWHPPIARRRVVRPKQLDCAFCGNPVLSHVNQALWRSSLPTS